MTTLRMLRVLAPGLILAGLVPLRVTGQAPPLLSIADQSIAEGNGGPQAMVFTVTLSSPSAQEVRVNYITFPGTATGGLLSTVFTSAGPITIPDAGPASAYPAAVNVSNVTGPTEDVLVAINGLTHPSPSDLDLLLVSPDGRRLLLQSDVGGAGAVSNVSYTFHESGPAMSTIQLGAGTVRPTSVGPADVFPSPAPAGPHDEAAPAGVATLESAFRDRNPNGQWQLYVVDDSPAGAGAIQSWHLNVGVSDPTKDYVTRAGQVVFPPFSTTQQIRISVSGDVTIEPNEAFRIALLAPVNAGLGDDQADGTILNDDGTNRPTAVGDAFGTIPGQPVGRLGPDGLLSNDLANNGGTLTAQLVSGPSHGTLQLNADGAFLYQPAVGFVGTDTFTYLARNSLGASDVATVTITILPLPTVPAPSNLRVAVLDDGIDPTQSHVSLRFDTSPVAVNHVINGGVVPGQPLVTVPTSSPHGIFTTAVPNGSFLVSAQAIDASNQISTISNEITLHNTTAVPPSPPENLLVVVDGSNLAIAWRNMYGGGIPTNTILNVTGSATASIPLGRTEAVSFAGAPAGTYNLSVFNTNVSGSSAISNIVPVTIPSTCSGPPLPPTDFLAYAPGPGRAAAIWDLPLSGPAPTSYRLRVDSAIFTGDIDILGHMLDVPAPAGTYTLAAAAANACGVSAFGPTQTFVVAPAP